MKLWLDDIRTPPEDEDWVWVTNVETAICFLQDSDEWEEVSLDHDLGEWSHMGGDGIALIDWMCENNVWPKTIYIHSGNPVGRDNMMRAIKRYGPYNYILTTIATNLD